jgi:hypothetical protein
MADKIGSAGWIRASLRARRLMCIDLISSDQMKLMVLQDELLVDEKAREDNKEGD